MDRVVLLLAFSLLLFTSPLTDWIAREGAPWYLPYLLWLGVIAAAAWLSWMRRRHDV
ncbi:MAG: hypothetical protein OEU36_05920 [Gammaproteobacteria bacterium]|nr:hypothetical protein [Gammaproteobacteria bacterium]